MHWTPLCLYGEQLRQLCRTSGVGVTIDTKNTRDYFYRASIDLVLNVCTWYVFGSA
jgi:hypothetical protein